MHQGYSKYLISKRKRKYYCSFYYVERQFLYQSNPLYRLLASLANIKVFVTGGIGGVHRGNNGKIYRFLTSPGAEKTFDISADLVELGQTPVAVVCAGAKV